MKKNEKIALTRVVTDIIKADTLIDIHQIDLYDDLQKEYDITRADHKKADSLTLAQAIETLSEMEDKEKSTILGSLKQLAISDGFYAQSESLLLTALDYKLTGNKSNQVQIISIKSENQSLQNNQILFVESGYKNNTNTEINNNHRQITTELKTIGFEFIYIPKIINKFNKSQTTLLEKALLLLTPQSSQEQIEQYKQRLVQMTTAGFCRDQLQYKLRIAADENIQPALLLNIGASQVEDTQYLNFMKLTLEDRVVKEVAHFVDTFSKYQSSTHHHNTLTKSTQERIIYSGFCKMMFDKHLLRSGVQSSVVIDTNNVEIIFSEINETLSGVHRREKALYTLFLMESDNGGIDFNKPDSVQQYKEYTLRQELIQRKYNAIYRMFGGEIENAPDLTISEIRLPMISRIKRHIMKLEGKLHNIDNYIIRRYKSGVYNLSIAKDSILSTDSRYQYPVQISLSEELGKIKRFV
ncbi:MAG: hypothetical protein R3Y19_01250 [Rikenellaceae bacterium]